MTEAEVEERARQIRGLVLDVDGVLTDGSLIYDEAGFELKAFHIQDGMGVSLWHRAGHRCAIISGRKSRVTSFRARELGIQAVYQNIPNKSKALDKILERFELKESQVCFIGDDIVDIPVLRRVGLGVAVANAVAETRQVAHYVTRRTGGLGAVRETVDMILRVQGLLDPLIDDLLSK